MICEWTTESLSERSASRGNNSEKRNPGVLVFYQVQNMSGDLLVQRVGGGVRLRGW